MLKNWFNLEDGQPYERELADQLKGLELVLARARGRSILDLGCGEALIGLKLLMAGATAYTGIELVPERVQAARGLLKHRPEPHSILQRDLSHFYDKADTYVPGFPQTDDIPWSHYIEPADIVLALAIAHKLSRPVLFLKAAARRAREWLVIRLPGPVICDPRSGNQPCDPVKLLAGKFEPIAFPLGHLDEWMVILQRRAIAPT